MKMKAAKSTTATHTDAPKTEVQSSDTIFKAFPLAPKSTTTTEPSTLSKSLLSDSVEEVKDIKKDSHYSVDFSRIKITRTLAPLGGSGASVYACEVDGLQCAMKEYRIERRMTNELDRFLKEIKMIEGLSHPNIVRYLYHETKREFVRVFLTRYESSLRHEVQKKSFDVKNDLDDPFSPKDIGCVMFDIVRGLRYLHKLKIIHRDLKTDNIFVNFGERGNIATAVIGDFDAAKSLANQQVAKTFVGTSNYMSPEIMRILITSKSDNIQTHYTEKTDIWSFGMVMYELLTLQLPYSSMSTMEANTNIQNGIRPPLPSPSSGLPRPGDVDSYAPIIEVYEACSIGNPDERLDSSTLTSLIESKMNELS